MRRRIKAGGAMKRSTSWEITLFWPLSTRGMSGAGKTGLATSFAAHVASPLRQPAIMLSAICDLKSACTA